MQRVTFDAERKMHRKVNTPLHFEKEIFLDRYLIDNQVCFFFFGQVLSRLLALYVFYLVLILLSPSIRLKRENAEGQRQRSGRSWIHFAHT